MIWDNDAPAARAMLVLLADCIGLEPQRRVASFSESVAAASQAAVAHTAACAWDVASICASHSKCLRCSRCEPAGCPRWGEGRGFLPATLHPSRIAQAQEAARAIATRPPRCAEVCHSPGHRRPCASSPWPPSSRPLSTPLISLAARAFSTIILLGRCAHLWPLVRQRTWPPPLPPTPAQGLY